MSKLTAWIVVFLALVVALLESAQLVMLVEKEARSRPRALSSEASRCYADGSGITCVATNTNPWPAVGCVRGIVTSTAKTFASAAVKVESQTVCFGTIAPYETKHVEGKWEIGEPVDICSTPDSLGNKRLNWDLCAFTLNKNPIPGAFP